MSPLVSQSPFSSTSVTLRSSGAFMSALRQRPLEALDRPALVTAQRNIERATIMKRPTPASIIA